MPSTSPLTRPKSLALMGRYMKDTAGVDLQEYEGRLYLTPVLGGMISSLFHVLIVTPVLWTMLKEWELRRGRLEVGKTRDVLKG